MDWEYIKFMIQKKLDWGTKHVNKTQAKQFNGAPSPVWKNPARLWILFLCFFGFFFCIGGLVSYVLKISTMDECSTSRRPIVIVQLILVALNCFQFISVSKLLVIFDFNFYKIQYASDTQWFRNIIYILFFSVLLLGGAFLGVYSVILTIFYMCILLQTIMFKDKFDEGGCVDSDGNPLDSEYSEMWKATFGITVVTVLFILIKICLIFYLIYRFYLKKNALAWKILEEEEED